MADFPRVGVHIDSEEHVVDAALVSRSRAGRVRMRRLYPAPVREYHVALRGLTDNERDAVESFLAINRAQVFNFYWPRGQTWRQVIWTDSDVKWADVGNRLSSTDLTFAVVT